MKRTRERGYSASLDIGHYPVPDKGNNIWNTFCIIFCCCCRSYSKDSDGYDSDSSDFNRYLDSDSDDE